MKRIIAILILASTLIISCACQPTPNEPIVVSKGDGQLQKTVYGTPAPLLSEPFSAPATWEEEIDGLTENKLFIKMNATVEVPSVLAYPIYRVTLHDYTNDDVKAFIKNTAGDAKLYTAEGKTVQETYEQPYTYEYASPSECKAIVEGCEYQLNDPNSPFNLYTDGFSDKEKKNTVKTLTTYRSIYRYMMDHQDEYLTKTDVEYDKMSLTATGSSLLTSDGNYKLYFETDRDRLYLMRCEFDAPTQQPLKNHAKTNTKHTDLNGITISEKEAKERAEDYVKSSGYTDWAVQNVGSAGINTIYDMNSFVAIYTPGFSGARKNGSDIPFYSRNKERKEMYIITFTPTLSGVPVLYTSNEETGEYIGRSFPMPSLSVGVDDSGVRMAELCNAAVSFECVNDNVSLIPFERVQDIFRRYIVMNTDFSDKYFSMGGGDGFETGQRETNGHEMTTLNIDRVKLGYVKIKEINERTFLAVPAWCFYGTEVNRFIPSQAGQLKLDDNNEVKSPTQAGHVFLCINAIDGSVIDLSKGY